MRTLTTSFSKDRKRFAAYLTFLAIPAAQAQGLAKATSFIENIRDQLTTWIPIIAVIAGLLLVVGYWFNMIQKDTFIKWLVGLIIAGSILEIVALFV